MKDNSAWGAKLGIRILEYQRSHSHFRAPCHDPTFCISAQYSVAPIDSFLWFSALLLFVVTLKNQFVSALQDAKPKTDRNFEKYALSRLALALALWIVHHVIFEQLVCDSMGEKSPKEGKLLVNSPAS